jgi:hypothetical protein
MSPYTVRWSASILQHLAQIWLQSNDRRAVTAAAAEIDHRLARDPLGEGKLLSEGLYRIKENPLFVTYTVDRVRRFVEVESIGYIP